MQQISEKTKTISIIGLITFIIGIAAWAVASITMFDKPLWGSFMHNFVYFTVITQGSFAVSMAVRLASGRWGSPFIRLASAVNMAFMPIAIIGLLTVFLNHNSIHWWGKESSLHPWFNLYFFIVRDSLYFLIFYSLSYKIFKTIRIKGSDVNDGVQHNIVILGFWLCLTYVLGMTIFSWDMSMTLNHGFGDTIYGFQFIISSFQGGLALSFILMNITSKYFGIKSFPDRSFVLGGQLQLALSIIWFYSWWSQFFPTWYSHIPEETGSFFIRAEGRFFPLYIAMIFLSAVIPFLILLFSKIRGSRNGLSAVGVIILTGLWTERYIQTNPAMEKFTPDTVSIIYLLNPINILLSIAIIGGFAFGLMRIINKRPDTFPPAVDEPEYSDDGLVSSPRGW